MTATVNVSDYLLSGKHPGRVALRLLDRDYTYGEVDLAAGAVVRSLHRAGAMPDDRAVLVADNGFFWVAAYIGILRAGCVCVPLPPAVSSDNLEYILQTTDARIIFADRGTVLKHSRSFHGCHLVTAQNVPAQPGVASQTALPDLCADRGTGETETARSAPSGLAALMFTSGSTGKPRGVMVSHSNIVANTDSIIQYLGLVAEDRMMTVLPFHYCFGTSLLHTHLRVGASLVIDARFMYPELVLQRMIDSRCTGFAGVPSHFQILLHRSTLRERRFPDLRLVQQAGGPLASDFICELRAALPGSTIFIMYGQTEATARLSYLPPEFLDCKLGSIGRGLPGTKLSVVAESGQPVRPGQVGEIVAEGANITCGYWRSESETAASFRDGRLYTGDLATVDRDGFIYIVGRAKDFLKCGGKRVSCRQLEEQVLACEGVLEAAVVAMPDGILGDAVKLFVVPRDHNENDFVGRLQLFCRRTMAPPLVPKSIVILDSLPKNGSGKVLKRELIGVVPPVHLGGILSDQ